MCMCEQVHTPYMQARVHTHRYLHHQDSFPQPLVPLQNSWGWWPLGPHGAFCHLTHTSWLGLQKLHCRSYCWATLSE